MECELPSFCNHSEPVARKRHKCCECFAPIEIGETYFSLRGKWPGISDKVITYRQHINCCAACMMIRDHYNDGECIGFGELMNEYHEYSRHGSRHDDDEIHQEFRDLMAMILWRQRKA